MSHADAGWSRILRSAVAVAVLALAGHLAAAGQGTSALPDRLTDTEFWALSQESSEPGGYFRSLDITNLTSNELGFQYVIPDLVARVKPGTVYLGVGPEQNFTYISAVRPAMAVIFDVRRGNLDLHLMYKALFELAADRAEFVSLLFAKPRPSGLGPASTADQIFSAFASVDTSQALYDKTRASIRTLLLKTRALSVPQRDLDGIDVVYESFFRSGFYVRSSPTYWDLMAATDAAGVMRSYLSTDERFKVLKDLHARNLIVPVTGDFGGPKAIRAIASYLKARRATVGAFYLSNVEQYLVQDGKWAAFCQNVAALPLDASSTFIRSSSGFGGGGRGGNFVNTLGAMAQETKSCGR
jgi:hypothetical protein